MYTELGRKKFLEGRRMLEGNAEVDIRETDERWVEWVEEILTRDRLS